MPFHVHGVARQDVRDAHLEHVLAMLREQRRGLAGLRAGLVLRAHVVCVKVACRLRATLLQSITQLMHLDVENSPLRVTGSAHSDAFAGEWSSPTAACQGHVAGPAPRARPPPSGARGRGSAALTLRRAAARASLPSRVPPRPRRPAATRASPSCSSATSRTNVSPRPVPLRPVCGRGPAGHFLRGARAVAAVQREHDVAPHRIVAALELPGGVEAHPPARVAHEHALLRAPRRPCRSARSACARRGRGTRGTAARPRSRRRAGASARPTRSDSRSRRACPRRTRDSEDRSRRRTAAAGTRPRARTRAGRRGIRGCAGSSGSSGLARDAALRRMLPRPRVPIKTRARSGLR